MCDGECRVEGMGVVYIDLPLLLWLHGMMIHTRCYISECDDASTMVSQLFSIRFRTRTRDGENDSPARTDPSNDSLNDEATVGATRFPRHGTF